MIVKRTRLLILLATLIVWAGCNDQTEPTLDSPVEPDAEASANAVAGVLLPGSVDDSVSGGRLALCRLDRPDTFFPLSCTPTDLSTTSGIDGRFDFGEVPDGTYALIIDTESVDFDSALADWQDAPIRPGDWNWIRDDFLRPGEGLAVNLAVPADLPATVDPVAYAVDTLLFEGSPFVVAHEFVGDQVRPVIIEVGEGPADSLSILEVSTREINRDVIRETIGPITREENLLIDRRVSERWAAFMSGEDAQYRDTDQALIQAIRDDSVHQIGSTYLTTIEEQDGDLVKAVAYGIVDTQSGENIIVAWTDEESGDVIEARTGFHLNVRDNPGEWIVAGPNGEQFYHYGFSYYRAWDQILPDPQITMIEQFYAQAPNHTSFFIEALQTSASEIGGDMNRLTWTIPALNEAIRSYAPAEQALPYLSLPDSGTIDVNRDRFLQAVIDGAVIVDRESLIEFLDSDFGQFGFYVQDPDPQVVIDALLTPYRSGHLFTDMEAAIIMAATYGEDDQPLTIQISDRLNQGVQVPRRTDKLIRVSRREVANVILGYGGTLNARWPHEMSHILDFRYGRYPFGRVGEESRCEPLKYMLEYMWWVQRYPFDAPDEDWMPIGSGLALARLLTSYYPNSGC